MVVLCIDPSIVCMIVSTLFSIALLLFVLRDYCRIILRFYQKNEKMIWVIRWRGGRRFLLFLPQNRGTSESNSVTIQKQMAADKNRSILLLSDRPFNGLVIVLV
jgi:hypothetical protein